MTTSLQERLRKAGIRHYDELIHDQPKDWLIKNFKAEGASPAYPVNVARLMRNLVWQMKERVSSGEKPFNELVRTYWYMYVKSTLARAGSLSAVRNEEWGMRNGVRRNGVSHHFLSSVSPPALTSAQARNF